MWAKVEVGDAAGVVADGLAVGQFYDGGAAVPDSEQMNGGCLIGAKVLVEREQVDKGDGPSQQGKQNDAWNKVTAIGKPGGAGEKEVEKADEP